MFNLLGSTARCLLVPPFDLNRNARFSIDDDDFVLNESDGLNDCNLLSIDLFSSWLPNYYVYPVDLFLSKRVWVDYSVIETMTRDFDFELLRMIGTRCSFDLTIELDRLFGPDC